MDSQFATQVVQYIEASSALTDRLLDRERTYAAQEKEAADRRPDLVDQMVKAGAIRPDQKSAADNMLRTTSGTLELLGAAIGKINSLQQEVIKAAAELGRPAAAPQAGSSNDSVQKQALYTGLKSVSPTPADAILAEIMNDPR
jgi:hypothetical protein